MASRTARNREPGHREPGSSTAVGSIVTYRIAKLESLNLVKGSWLDCGCADGGYSEALLDGGAESVTGIDPEPTRIDSAQTRARDGLTFLVGDAERMPLADQSFDGVLLNEVLEHVDDERETLREIRRVLRPNGHLALFSPNRIFPFEGHGLRFSETRTFGHPAPLVPWLPLRFTHRYMCARNYWPWQLRAMVEAAGFHIDHTSSAFPQFEIYPWLPSAVIPVYRRAVGRTEKVPILRWLGVSCFIVARPAR